jgi:hypothetical protein
LIRSAVASPVQGASRASPTRPNGLLKDAIIQAAEEAGGKEGIVGYLTQQARKNPVIPPSGSSGCSAFRGSGS